MRTQSGGRADAERDQYGGGDGAQDEPVVAKKKTRHRNWPFVSKWWGRGAAAWCRPRPAFVLLDDRDGQRRLVVAGALSQRQAQVEVCRDDRGLEALELLARSRDQHGAA